MEAPFTLVEGGGPLVAVAIHAGHDLRPDVAKLMKLDDDTRRREEDPGTDRLTCVAPTRVVAHRSRFEVDLNRPRDGAVYCTPAEAWGLDVWHEAPDPATVAGSLEIYDEFYDALRVLLDGLASEHGHFVVLDIHSYNHRRDGAGAPAAPELENPEINVGTGSLDRVRWADVVVRFMTRLSMQTVDGHHLDVRENVRFQGGHLAQWVNTRYAACGCALAIEFKKTYMDEWTGVIDDARVAELTSALAAALP